MSYKYTYFIPENTAPNGAKRIGVYRKNGDKTEMVCGIPLGRLEPVKKEPLYSVGVISDPHIYGEGESSYKPNDDKNASEDLQRALTYLRDKVAFTCVCGDLTSWGTTVGFEKYQSIVETYRGNMPVYAIAGNHEYWGAYYGGGKPYPNIPTEIKTYTGLDLFDVVEYGNDVFIFGGASAIQDEFTTISVKIGDETKTLNKYDWLVEQFDRYKGRRIFLFMHCFLFGEEYCGDSTGIINTHDMIKTYKDRFISLLRANPNVIYFHGHSHTLLEMQEYMESLMPPLPANYDNACGVPSIHIPSVTMPRDISSGVRVENGTKSQGYIVDVHDDCIVLNGMDFVNELPVPLGTFKIDTR
jgi:hypothetical protein